MAGHLKPDHLLNVNPQQFINSENKEAIYILGLIWADGYISRYINKKTNKKTYRIEIQLVSSDMQQLIPILNKTGKWNIHNSNYINKDNIIRKPRTSVITNSKKLHTFLADNDYHIKSQASPNKILQIIPHNLHHYFWHGFFDGDGSIWISKSGYHKQLALCGSYEQDWSSVITLCEHLNIKYIHNIINASCKCHNIKITNKEGIIKFTSYIYQDNTIIGLKRKYDKAKLINPSI